MIGSDRMIKWALIAIAFFLGVIAVRPYLQPDVGYAADPVRFDYAYIVSPSFLYNGRQGILLLDKRNGNAWFLGKNNDNMKLSFADPVFVVRVPLEKLDQAPQ
jgi:hypothetical protein